MQYPQLPLIAFLSAFLVLVPLPSHWRAHNVATLALIFWLFFTNVIYGVNAIVWAGNVNDYIPVWCDISEHLSFQQSFSFNPEACFSDQIYRWCIIRSTSMHFLHM